MAKKKRTHEEPEDETLPEANEEIQTDGATNDWDIHPSDFALPVESRASRRMASELKAIIQFHTDPEEKWKEVTKVTSVSKTGAGFTLSRPCPIGGLVSIVLPMPEEFRLYDFAAELYSIIGLVQYCHSAPVEGHTVYHLGVAFAGSSLPESYQADPMQSYRITGAAPGGLWAITEAKAPFKERATARFSITLEVTISLLKKAGREVNKEQTITRNISSTGAGVVCSLETKIGDRVKFACEEYGFYTLAVVRNRKQVSEQITTLHLEFIDNKFPLEKVSPQRSVVEPD